MTQYRTRTPALAILLWAIPLGAAPKTEMVPMRDGVHLATDIYLPEGQGPWPVVLERTPYNRKRQGGKSTNFVSHGYV